MPAEMSANAGDKSTVATKLINIVKAFFMLPIPFLHANYIWSPQPVTIKLYIFPVLRIAIVGIHVNCWREY